MSLLRVQDLTKRFGGLIAVNDVSFDVEEGEILAVIGPNGAGKSTLFKLIASFLKPTAGQVLFNGERISGQKPHLVAQKGRGPHLPGDHRLQGDDGARERRRRPPHAARRQPARRLLRDPDRPRRRAPLPRQRRRDPGLPRPRPRRAREGQEPPARLPQGARHRARHGGRAQDPAARRALRRHEPGGEGPRRPHGPRHPRPRRHRAAGRARHALGDAHLATASSSSASAPRSPRARPPRSSATTPSSRPISAARTRSWGTREESGGVLRLQGPLGPLRQGPRAATASRSSSSRARSWR